MQTITMTIRKGYDVVSEILPEGGIGLSIGVIERKRFNDGTGPSTRYTPLNLDMEPLADPQLSSAAAIAIIRQNAA